MLKNMKIKKRTDSFIQISMVGNLNWMATVKLVELVGDMPEICLDLSRIRFVDSEGIILLCKWNKEGRKIWLIDPPAILKELVAVLQLEEILDVEKMSCKK